jgi:anthranilate synthase/aminodeoxychorismate synthase-like glutamine amidotransferase
VNLLLIDNYDSFTFNLVQQLGELGAGVEVVRNDAESVDDCLQRGAQGLVVSPGPGRPEQAGITLEAVRSFAASGVPVLGVCLGLQAIATVYGASVVRAHEVMHGKVSAIHHDGRGVFRGLPEPLRATRYHSLAVREGDCPESLEVSARSGGGEVMGLRHRRLEVEGVQFHPESILTVGGRQLLGNFVELCARRRPR